MLDEKINKDEIICPTCGNLVQVEYGKGDIDEGVEIFICKVCGHEERN